MGAHTSADDSHRRVLDAIRRIIQVLRLTATRAERELDLSAAQLFVLQKLHETEGITMNELATRTHTHQSSVSVVVHRLVEKRLVRRERSVVDGRQVNIHLTSAGARKVRIAPETAQDTLIQSLKSMRKHDRIELARLLEQFAAGAGADSALPGMFFEEQTKKKRGRKQSGRKRN